MYAGQQHGAVRIIPPPGWRARGDEGYESADVLLRCCGRQHSEGDCGMYELTVEETDGLYLSDFRKLAANDEHEDADQRSEPRAMEREFWQTLGKHGALLVPRC
jgi:hypothetical protein